MEGEKMSSFKLLFPIILLLFLGGCSYYDEKTIKHVLEKEDFTNIEEIVIHDGFTYALTFLEGSKKLSISNNKLHDTYYTTKQDLTEIIDTFYKTIE